MKKLVNFSPRSSSCHSLALIQPSAPRLSPLTLSLQHIDGHRRMLAMLLGSVLVPIFSQNVLAFEPTLPNQAAAKQSVAPVTPTDLVTDPVISETVISDPVDSEAGLDVTTYSGITPVAAPLPESDAARTRPNYKPTPTQQASLDRLKTFYQPTKPAEDQGATKRQNPAMCHGNWVYPTSTIYQQQALEAAQSDLPNSAFPIHAAADYGYYDNDNYAELAGNVEINQGRQQISADKVVVAVKEGIAAAQGNVLVVDAAQSQDLQTRPTNIKDSNKGGLITVANEFAYQTDSAKATAKDVAFASVPLQAHGYAKKLNKIDESHVQIDDVMFTTCAPDNPTWQINAKNIDMDTDTGRGEARHATLKIKNTPVLYLPYFNFPIDDRRTSGFLLPRAGFSSEGSFTVQLPYYLNLAPNYDATLTPTIFTDRNPMATGQFRYLTHNYGEGQLTGSYLPRDKQYEDEDRKRFIYNHHWQSPILSNLAIDALYQYVSDPSFISNFETLGDETVQLNLPRRLQASYYNDYVTALAKVESFQTLDRNLSDAQKIADKDKPYERLPQLSLKYRLPWVTDFDVTGISDFAYFKRPINDGSAPEQSGGRFYNKISASYPVTRTWGYVTPSVSLQHLYTQYDQQSALANGKDKDSKSQSIFVPQVSVDSGLNFFKAGTPFGKFDESLGGYQLVSPRLKYVYSPYKDQSEVPNFNTRLASLNFPQLYEDSWFLGYDRLPDNNHLTPSLNYRYIDRSGLTRLDASIGKQFYLSDIRVHLDNTNDGLKLDNTGTVFQVSTQPRQDFWLDLDGSVNDHGDLNYFNTQLRHAPDTRSLYNLGFVKRNASKFGQKSLSAVTGSAIFPISDHWRFLGAAQYDTQQNHFSDVLAGFTYDSCCYGLSIYGRRYYDELGNNNKAQQAIMAEISLTGLSNKGSGQLANLIQNRVLGYNPNH